VARTIGLTFPRFLLRGAHRGVELHGGAVTYDERIDADDAHCWGSAAFAFATRLIESFVLYRWCPNIVGQSGGGSFGGLPVRAAPGGGETPLEHDTGPSPEGSTPPGVAPEDATVVEWLGGWDVLTVDLAGLEMQRWDDPPASRALEIVARELVVVEADSVWKLRAYVRATEDPAIRAVFQVLLADEARHLATGKSLEQLLPPNVLARRSPRRGRAPRVDAGGRSRAPPRAGVRRRDRRPWESARRVAHRGGSRGGRLTAPG
jgi:hypothetical protein